MARRQIRIPTKPAQCADLLYKTRQQRLNLEREVKKLEELESALKEYFINNLSKQDSTGIAGQLARVQIKPEVVPIVEDWPKFYNYVKKTGEFELLQKRLSRQAVEERWEAKRTVPGIGRLNAKKVSCTLIKGN